MQFSHPFMQLHFLLCVLNAVHALDGMDTSESGDRDDNQIRQSLLTGGDSNDDVTIPRIQAPPRHLSDDRTKAAVVSGPDVREAFVSLGKEAYFGRKQHKDRRTMTPDESCQYTFTVPRHSSHCSSSAMEMRLEEMHRMLGSFQYQMNNQRRRLEVAETFIRKVRGFRRDSTVSHSSRSESSAASQYHYGNNGASRALQDLSEEMQIKLSNLEIQIEDAESKRLKLQLRNLNLTRILLNHRTSIRDLSDENSSLNATVTRLKEELDAVNEEKLDLLDNQRLLISEKVNHEEARQLLVERAGRLSLENEDLSNEAISLRGEVEELRAENLNDREQLQIAETKIAQLNSSVTSLQRNLSSRSDPERSSCSTASERTRVDDDYKEILPNYTTCGILINISDPETIRQSKKPILYRAGVWMKDPLATKGSTKIWAINQSGFKVRKLFQYPNISAFREHKHETIHTLPHPMESNGAVVYNGSLYYQRRNSRRIVRYKIGSNKATMDRSIKRAGFHGMFAYQWGGFTDIDFAVDETGLWVIYSTPRSKGNILVTKINPETLLPVRKTVRTPIPKRKVANAFIICQVLYTVSGFKASEATINAAFDLNKRSLKKLDIPFVNNYRFNSMIDYNPRDRYIYSWDNGRQVRYQVTLDDSMGKMRNEKFVSNNGTLT